MGKPTRDASGRFVGNRSSQGDSNGPSQGQPNGPSQGQPDCPSQGPAGGASAPEADRASSAASLFCRPDEFSDTDDSNMDTSAAESDRFKRKRSEGSSGSTGGKSKKKSKSKKASTSASASTHDVGLVDAERQLNLAKKQQLQLDLEERVAAKEKQAQAARARAGYGASNVLYADHSLAELERMAAEDREEVVEVASKSSNLKGTFQKALKCRAASMHGIIAELVRRTATEETRQLQAKVDRLQAEVSQLHQKLAEATARPAQSAPGPVVTGPSSSHASLEETFRKVVMEERAFTRACIAGIEDRLLPEKRLRPPLAADMRPPPMELVPAPIAGPVSGAKPSKGKGKGRRTKAGPHAPTTSTEAASGSTATPAAPQNPQEEDALLPSSTPANQSWTEVVKKGKRRKKGKKHTPKPSATAPAAKRAPAGGRKLVPPKTAAVVVTLTAEAVGRGETYASIMTRARTNADPKTLGISTLSCRRTQAGARIFEFPGAQGGANADLFATKLQEVIADAASVARPVKSVALEVTELDDSVTKEEVEAAVAAIGGCGVAEVKGRAIRPGRSGMGTIRLECPVAAAVAVLAKGRVAVGFSSGVVRALAARRLRCYKCLGVGHTRPLCPSGVDRGNTCYRCGKDGHKSASCEATTPHCAVCAASGCPADHVTMGRNCNPPPKKGKEQAPIRPVAATAVPEAGTSADVEGGAMSD